MRFSDHRLTVLVTFFTVLIGCDSGQKKPDGPLALLQAENQALRQDNAALHSRAALTVDSLAEQCITAGLLYTPAPSEEPVAVPDHAVSTSGECLDCHESHGKPVCQDCHDEQAQDPGHSQTGHTVGSDELPMPVVLASYAQPVENKGVGDIDGSTGASGDFYYGDASYLDANYLASRINGTVDVYQWKPAGDDYEGVSTLAAACKLAQRDKVEELFPDDGKNYKLKRTGNQMGAKLVSTVNTWYDESSAEYLTTPNIATFGYGMIEDGGTFYMTLDIGRNNTCRNAIHSGDMRFSYYEYRPDKANKKLRNRGARIIGRVDYERTALKGPDWKTAIPGFGSDKAFDPKGVDWNSVGLCALVVEVKGIIPLG